MIILIEGGIAASGRTKADFILQWRGTASARIMTNAAIKERDLQTLRDLIAREHPSSLFTLRPAMEVLSRDRSDPGANERSFKAALDRVEKERAGYQPSDYQWNSLSTESLELRKALARLKSTSGTLANDE
jgi:hypothetical protein